MLSFGVLLTLSVLFFTTVGRNPHLLEIISVMNPSNELQLDRELDEPGDMEEFNLHLAQPCRKVKEQSYILNYSKYR